MNMKSRISLIGVLSFAISALVMIGACNKFDAPPAIWNPNQSYATGAVISEIVPANSAIAGVREITVVGRNFSKVADSNWVWFGTQQAIIKSVSLNAAADTLVFFRPPNFGQLTLKVVIPASDSIGISPYGLESPVSTSDISSISSTNLVMEAGKNDTMWIGSWISSAAGCYIYKLSPNRIDISVFKDSSYLQPKINKKATDFAQNFVDMKFGPGGFLYATFNKSNTLYCLEPDSSTPTVYAKFTASNSVGYFDFDENRNLYTGKSNGLFLVKPGATPLTGAAPIAVGDYAGITFVEIRVFKDANGNRFVYAANSTSLWMSPINADGTVGGKQQLVNIASDTALTGDKITSINIASDGTLFLSLSGNSTYSLYVLGNNGLLTPYYKDNILPTGIDQLIWGNDRFLYLSRGKTGLAAAVRFYKMGMAKADNTPLHGAPYLGRGL
jgi:IPT/TIG domain